MVTGMRSHSNGSRGRNREYAHTHLEDWRKTHFSVVVLGSIGSHAAAPGSILQPAVTTGRTSDVCMFSGSSRRGADMIRDTTIVLFVVLNAVLPDAGSGQARRYALSATDGLRLTTPPPRP